MLAPRSSIYWITLQHSECLHDWNMEITKPVVQWLPRVLPRNLGSMKSYSKLLPKLFIRELRYVLFSHFNTCPWPNFQVKLLLVHLLENIPKKKKNKKNLKKETVRQIPSLLTLQQRKSLANKKINAWFVNKVWETAQNKFSSSISLPQQSPIKSYVHLSSLKIQSLYSYFRDLLETKNDGNTNA